MTIQEAKEYYFQFHGLGFHMFRENNEKYEQFQKLHIKKNIIESWKHEILDNDILTILSGEKEAVRIGNYIDLYGEITTKTSEYANKLFEILNYASNNLDSQQKIIIMEDMAGRNENLSDGGIRYVCQKTSLKKELKKCMEKFVDFNYDFTSNDIGWDNPKDRYLIALQNIQKALKKYSKRYRVLFNWL